MESDSKLGTQDTSAAGAVLAQRVYGKGHALKIEAQQARSGAKTLGFEFAARKSGEKQAYAWDEKLIIQLKPDHLPLYAAVLLGDLPKLELSHYGDARSKSFEVEQQDGGLLVMKGLAEGKGHAVPVLPERVFWLSAQAVGRVCDHAGGVVDPITAKALIRRTAELWTARTKQQARSKS